MEPVTLAIVIGIIIGPLLVGKPKGKPPEIKPPTQIEKVETAETK